MQMFIEFVVAISLSQISICSPATECVGWLTCARAINKSYLNNFQRKAKSLLFFSKFFSAYKHAWNVSTPKTFVAESIKNICLNYCEQKQKIRKTDYAKQIIKRNHCLSVFFIFCLRRFVHIKSSNLISAMMWKANIWLRKSVIVYL